MSNRSEKRRRERAKQEAAEVAGAPDRTYDALLVAALVVLTFIVFGRLGGAEFLSWDDYSTVSRNPHLNPPSFASLVRYWREPYGDLYIPVTYTVWSSLALLSGSFGPGEGGASLHPAVFHLTNVAVHAGAGVVLFLLIRRLGAGPAAAAAGAAAFVVHPVQVETVAWVSGLKDLLCTFFVLVSLWQYVGFATATVPKRRRISYAVATVAFVLALLSKPTAVVTPGFALAIDALILRRPWRQIAAALGPWLVPAAACLAWTKAAQPAEYAASGIPLYVRPLIATDALYFYVYKLLWPAALAIDYGRTPEAVVSHGWHRYTWIVPAILAALLASQRKRRWLLAGALVFAGGVAPVLGLVRFDFQLISTTADHYLYPSMIGVALALAGMLTSAGRPRVPLAVTAAVLLVLAIRSGAQAAHWRDNQTLFRHTLAVNPRSWTAMNSLAADAVEAGDAATAVAFAQQAAARKPNDPRVLGTLGAALAMQGKLPEATRAMEQALALEPTDARMMSALAGLLAHQGRLDEAMVHARRAVDLDASNAEARLNLGTMLAQSGRVDDGIAELEAAARLAPASLPQAHANLGFLLLSRGRRQEAAERFQTALRIDPNFAPAAQGLQQARQP